MLSWTTAHAEAAVAPEGTSEAALGQPTYIGTSAACSPGWLRSSRRVVRPKVSIAVAAATVVRITPSPGLRRAALRKRSFPRQRSVGHHGVEYRRTARESAHDQVGRSTAETAQPAFRLSLTRRRWLSGSSGSRLLTGIWTTWRGCAEGAGCSHPNAPQGEIVWPSLETPVIEEITLRVGRVHTFDVCDLDGGEASFRTIGHQAQCSHGRSFQFTETRDGPVLDFLIAGLQSDANGVPATGTERWRHVGI